MNYTDLRMRLRVTWGIVLGAHIQKHHGQIRKFIAVCGFATLSHFSAEAVEPEKTDPVSSDYVDTQSYDISLVQITPIMKQWVETPIEQNGNISPHITDKVKDSNLSGQNIPVAKFEKLPLGVPTKFIDLATFRELNLKQGARVYWHLNAIFYQNTIYLLE